MPFLDINDICLHFEQHSAARSEAPERPPLLMLSGMASDSASWLPLVDGLRQQQSLLIPDNRCTGRTGSGSVASSRDVMIADILAMLDALGIERVNVLGHSMGGMLGWALACQAPERVSRLVCAAALPQIIPARIALFQSLLAMRTEDNEAHWFALLYQFLFRPEFFADPDAVAAALEASLAYPYKQNLTAFGQQVDALPSFLPPLPLAQRRCPVTLLTGSQDMLMTPQMLFDFRQQHPDVTVQIVDGAAHALHWEQAGRVLAIVEDALSRPLD
ncbi:alpha/beta fold hydrolase [Granulosicoccus sp. 3-233]|uniref:alpha/beta fold hydrolase n=1 Tax=Granulosicoccus sp. 3-233 TaxID=3417969 RepID=UPI003D355ACA